MRKGIETISFVLLLIGTFGFLVNEFVFKWTTIVTLTFAVANVIGLFALGIAYLSGIATRAHWEHSGRYAKGLQAGF